MDRELRALLDALLDTEGQVVPEVLERLRHCENIGPRLMGALFDHERRKLAETALVELPEFAVRPLMERLLASPCGEECVECQFAGCFTICGLFVKIWKLARERENTEVQTLVLDEVVGPLVTGVVVNCRQGPMATRQLLTTLGTAMYPKLEELIPTYPWKAVYLVEQEGSDQVPALLQALENAELHSLGTVFSGRVLASEGIYQVPLIIAAVWSESEAASVAACEALKSQGPEAAIELVAEMDQRVETADEPCYQRALELLRSMKSELRQYLEQVLEHEIASSARCRADIQALVNASS